MMRIGNGYDVHAFTEGDEIILGGVRIPHNQGLLAHSDGDVLIHALVDALVGALAMGDIGQFFPDDDPKYKDVDSRLLLRHVHKRISTSHNQTNYRLLNCDCTIVAQKPKMAPHIPAMRENIAADLGVNVSQVSVKATTTEKLGFTGREEGIAVYAVVLLEAVERDGK